MATPTTAAKALKEYFSTPDKPVTNTELLDLRRGDAAAYTALSQSAAKALGQELPSK